MWSFAIIIMRTSSASNQMKKILFILLLNIIFTSTNALSQESTSSVTSKLLIDAGVEYGGDEILKVYFTNGGDQSMKAGQGAFVAVGGDFRSKKIMLRASVGLKFNTTAAENANIRFTRVPINVIPYWRITEDIRFGVGVTSHQKIHLTGDGFVSDMDFTSKMRPRVEVGYKWAALTYTSMTYKDEFNDNFSATSLGFSASFTVPNKL
jgi:hypothetical protein